MPLTVHLTPSPTEDARLLVAELDEELNAEYPPEQRHGLPLDRIFQPHVRFFIARLDDQPVGCGAVAFYDDQNLAEVKRMYVRPHARGKHLGVAAAILARLEGEARARNIPRLALETGDIRHAAIRFYTRCGFTPCAAFGAYTSMPPNAIERSVFFEKPL